MCRKKESIDGRQMDGCFYQGQTHPSSGVKNNYLWMNSWEEEAYV